MNIIDAYLKPQSRYRELWLNKRGRRPYGRYRQRRGHRHTDAAIKRIAVNNDNCSNVPQLKDRGLGRGDVEIGISGGLGHPAHTSPISQNEWLLERYKEAAAAAAAENAN